MQENRKNRLASVIRDELSVQIRALKDPRVPNVTITNIEVVEDGSHATLSITLLGGNDDREKVTSALAGLNSASGLLRRHLGKVLTIRHIPSLAFKEDRGLENTLRVNELLKQLEESRKEAGAVETESPDDAAKKTEK